MVNHCAFIRYYYLSISVTTVNSLFLVFFCFVLFSDLAVNHSDMFLRASGGYLPTYCKTLCSFVVNYVRITQVKLPYSQCYILQKWVCHNWIVLTVSG